MNVPITKYGGKWSAEYDALSIELECIRRGGHWQDKRGNGYGLGLFEHYMNARRLLWPNRYRHRWTELLYKHFISHRFVMMLGPASAGKTAHAAEFLLIKYWAYPNNFYGLVSTTTTDKLESAIFGEIKKLWSDAKEHWDWLDGHVIDYKHAIATDDIAEGEVRDLRRGVAGKPCYSGRNYVGRGIYAGIKQEHIVFIADELQWMDPTFLAALDNLYSNPDVTVIGSGNPQHNPEDQLSIAAEPIDGWSSMPEPEKTTTWPLRLYDGVCINLVGTDSPNFDVPEGCPAPYPRLINRSFVEMIARSKGRNSAAFYSQCKGVMRMDLAKDRVITREICRQHKALDNVVWLDNHRTRILSCDPAYGGGDRCTSLCLEYGINQFNKTVLHIVGYREIPINIRKGQTPEQQIAEGMQEDMEKYGVPPENAFYLSFGKGTIGFAMAQLFGARSPVPIDDGARPTERPVRQDLTIWDNVKKRQRPKKCSEHYSKFVTEMWFSVRYAIEADQLFGMTEELIHEGCSREYYTVAGDKLEVEPKEDMKERLGRSPDNFDCFIGNTKILTPNGLVSINKIKEGDSVITPYGTANVAIVHKVKSDKLSYVQFSDGSKLIGKPKHKVFTWNKGWVRLDCLSVDMECESVYNLPIWHTLNSLFTKAKPIGFKLLVDTIKTEIGVPWRGFYTGLSGESITAIFQKACASIMSTMIGRITELRIFKCYPKENINHCTWLNGLSLSSGSLMKSLQLAGHLQPSGIAAMLANGGIKNIAWKSGEINDPAISHANFAASNSPQLAFKQQGSAPIHVPAKNEESVILTLLKFAWCVVKNFWHTGTVRRSTVPVTVRQLQSRESKWVYNLTLDRDNVYYANGILVDNCLAAGVEGARRRGFVIDRIGPEPDAEATDDYLLKEQEEYEDILKSKLMARA